MRVVMSHECLGLRPIYTAAYSLRDFVWRWNISMNTLAHLIFFYTRQSIPAEILRFYRPFPFRQGGLECLPPIFQLPTGPHSFLYPAAAGYERGDQAPPRGSPACRHVGLPALAPVLPSQPRLGTAAVTRPTTLNLPSTHRLSHPAPVRGVPTTAAQGGPHVQAPAASVGRSPDSPRRHHFRSLRRNSSPMATSPHSPRRAAARAQQASAEDHYERARRELAAGPSTSAEASAPGWPTLFVEDLGDTSSSDDM